MAEQYGKASYASLKRALGMSSREEREAARQAYEKEYADGVQILPWALKTFLDRLPRLTFAGEALNELLKQRGNMGAVYERAPGAIPALVEHIARALKLSAEAVKAALGLPLSHDALDVALLAVVHERAHEARNGLLPLHCIVDTVNVGCAPNDGLTPKFIGGRMRALGYVITDHHPAFVVVIPRLLPSEADTAHTRLLPSPEEPRANEHTENGSRTP